MSSPISRLILNLILQPIIILLFSSIVLSSGVSFIAPQLSPGDQLWLYTPEGQYRYLSPVSGEAITFLSSKPGTYLLVVRHPNGSETNVSSITLSGPGIGGSNERSGPPSSEQFSTPANPPEIIPFSKRKYLLGSITDFLPPDERIYPGNFSSSFVKKSGTPTSKKPSKRDIPYFAGSTARISGAVASSLESARRLLGARAGISAPSLSFSGVVNQELVVDKSLVPQRAPLTLDDIKGLGFDVEVVDEYGNPSPLPLVVINNTFVPLFSRAVKPGVYRVIVTDPSTGESSESWFSYGLISLNTQHPLYHPGEWVKMLIVVLDKSGFPVSGADIKVVVSDPDGSSQTFTTGKPIDDHGIVSTSQRGVYKLWYGPTNVTGNYTVLSSTVMGGFRVSSSTYFSVEETFPFDIEREAPMTIDPEEGPFKSRIRVTSLGPYATNVTLVERLPASFIVTNSTADNAFMANDTIFLVWDDKPLDYLFYYEAQTPLLSPYLYELGKASVSYTGGVFYEARPWLLAIDPAAITCSSSPCDTGTLIDSRDSISGASEPNQPNTIDTCTDGTSGSYHSDESIDRIVIADLNRSSFTSEDTIQVNITVWCWGTADNLNWVYTNNSVSPSWRVMNSINCPSGGSLQTFSYTFPLDDTPGNHTIRGVFQYNGASSATCGTGSYDDNDDVTLAVAERDRTPPSNNDLGVNDSEISINESVTIFASVFDAGGVDNVSALVKYPNGSSLVVYLLNGTASVNRSTSDLENGEVGFSGSGVSVIGETGSLDVANFTWHWVDFRNRYGSKPVVIATPATENTGDENGLIPVVKDINNSGFNVTICKDTATPYCNTSAALETLHYVVIDRDAISSLSWIDAGWIVAATDGSSTTASWGKTFSNAPSVWATVNSYNQTYGELAATEWVDAITTTGTTKFIGCTHQGTGNSCDLGNPYETFGYLAVDTTAADISSFESGIQDIRNSAWTSVSFSPVYSDPIIMVLQNDDDGGQDPEYPWARSVSSSGAQIRYCEQDGYGDCDTHTSEFVVWGAFENGSVSVASYSPDQNSTYQTYNDVSSDSFTSINGITITINVSSYSFDASDAFGNNLPDLEVELYNGSDWVSLGVLGASGAGVFSASTSSPDILSSWLSPANRDLRIRGVYLDRFNTLTTDEINYTGVVVEIGGEDTLFSFGWNNTADAGVYNITDLWSYDLEGNLNHTFYNDVTFKVLNTGPPTITINDVEGDTTPTYSFTSQNPVINATVDSDSYCYLSSQDESYSQMVANGRVSCGFYYAFTKKSCLYSDTLAVGSSTIYMSCNNTLSGQYNDVSNNKDIPIDVLCDSHADCPDNKYCDYTGHCALDVVDGYECALASFNGLPADEVCGGGSDLGTCINDSSYNFTGWYCAHDSDDCVYNDSGHTYDLNYSLCDPSGATNDYKLCGPGQEWSSWIDCGDLNEGADNDAVTHPGSSCSFYSSAQTCSDGDLDLGSYGCLGSSTSCNGYIYLGSGVCGSTLNDCDVGCGASCDSNNDTSPSLSGGFCYFDKSCSDSCSWFESVEEAPDYCINDNDGGPCAIANRTDPSYSATCYYNLTCQDSTGASLLNSSALRQDYCDYCSVSGSVLGAYSPAPNASCYINCSNSGIIFYDSTPSDRSDDCDGLGRSLLANDTLTYGDVWDGNGPAYCDNNECESDAGPYLNGTCVGGSSGVCTFSDPEPPIMSVISPNPPDDYWFASSPAVFYYSVNDTGSGVDNCSLYINGVLHSTTSSPQEGATLNFSYYPSLGTFTWGLECIDNSNEHNRAYEGDYNSGYDNTNPSIISQEVNETNLSVNQQVCLNVTVSDTYSGVNTVYAEIKLPGGNGIINITLTDDASSCDSGTGNNVFSLDYNLLFDGTYEWIESYAADKAGNSDTQLSGLSWNVSAGGYLSTSMTTPQSNKIINESGNYNYYLQNCSVRCTDDGINCENVILTPEYNNGSFTSITSSGPLYSATPSYNCGNLTPAPASWWNSSWSYRKGINITQYAEDVTEYQLMLRVDTQNLISSGKLNSDCSDLRFATRNADKISYYIDEGPGLGCGHNDTLVWVKVPALYQNYKNKIFMYYGNPSAASESNISDVFSYNSQKPIYYAVGDFNTRSGYNIISYTDNNQVTLSGNSESTTINEGQIYSGYSASDISAGDYWLVKGPLAFGCTAANCDSPIPISYAGTKFIIFIDRGGTGKEWFVYAPFGGGTVYWYNASSGGAYSSTPLKTLNVAKGSRYYVTDADGNDNDIFLINSTTPILLGFEQGTSDTMVIHPADKDFWGISEDISYAYSSTSRELCESNAPCATTTRDGPYRESLGGSADGTAPASHVSADKDLGYSMTADGDGVESYYAQPEYEFSPFYYVPVDFQYLAGAVTGGSSCNWTNRSSLVSVSLSGSYSYPAPKKLYIGDGTYNPVNSYGAAGDKLVCPYPLFLAIEPNNNDEANIWSYKQARQMVWPEPEPAFNNEESYSSIDLSGSTCSYEFTVLADNSGNNTFPVRCLASSSNSATKYSDSVNITVNDKPTPIINNLENHSWIGGVMALNGTLSFDSDGTISNYLYEYDDNPLMSSPSIICDSDNPLCLWDTTSQDQCANNSMACYLLLVATDNNGLSNKTVPLLIGFDTNGPITAIELVGDYGNITGNTQLVNATAVDNGVGIIGSVIFEYRINYTSSWSLICEDADGPPYECVWNLSLLPDGRYYELRARSNDSLGNYGPFDYSTNITVDRTPPVVDLLGPANNTYTLGNETLFYNVTDYLLGVDNCSLYLDGLLVNTTTNPVEGLALNFSVSDLSEQTHSWLVSCYDDLGNEGLSEERKLIVDLSGPVTLLERPPSSGDAYGLYTVNASVTDYGVGNISTVTFEYRFNSSSSWFLICNDSDGPPYECLWNTTNISDGPDYQVRAYANDTLGNIGSPSTHFPVRVDNNPPDITLVSPYDGFMDTDGNLDFEFYATDDGSSLANCSLIFNGSLNQTINNPSEGSHHHFYLYGLNDSEVNWSIICWDTFSQPRIAQTPDRRLIINIIYFMNATVTTDKAGYEKGDEAGETAQIRTNTTDFVNESLDAGVTTDIINTTGESHDIWWDTSWQYRKRVTITETLSVDRTNYWVNMPFIIDSSCEGLADKSSLRLVRDVFNSQFYEWNISYCDATHVKSLWVSFRTNISANESQDIYLYFNSSSYVSQTAIDRGPMRLVWVSTGGSGNAPNTNTIKGDISSALSNLSLSSIGFYNELSTSASASDLSLSDIKDYPIVLYDSGAKYSNSWDSTEGAAMRQYVDQGGGLFLAGQDLGYDANQDAWIYNNDFTNTTLVSGGWTDNTNPSTFTVNADHPVTKYIGGVGTTVSVAGDYEDGYTVLADGVWLLNWTGSGNPIASTARDCLSTDNCGYGKTVYYSGLIYISTSQGIQNAQAREKFFRGIIEWMLTNNSLSSEEGVLEEWKLRNSSSTGSDGLWDWLLSVYGLPFGTYQAVSQGEKAKYNNASGWVGFNVTPDSQPPVVSLISPPDNGESNSSVTFSYSVTDLLSAINNCSLIIDGVYSDTDDTVQESIPQFFYPRIPSGGPHNWTVCCYDTFNNSACADNRTVIIIPPELTSNEGNISRTPGPYFEGMNVTINATIWNLGGSDTPDNFTVQLWYGVPGLGTKISPDYNISLTDQFGNHQNKTLVWNWTLPSPGPNTLHLIIDPPLESNGSIIEINESNNDVAFNMTVPAYTLLYGNITSNILLDSSENKSFINFTNIRNNTGLLFFADADSSINFGGLQALGRRSDNNPSNSDFSEADALMNMDDFNDSVNNVWAQGNNTPSQTTNLIIRGSVVEGVPIVRTSPSFYTGILWDSSADTNSEYDSSDKEPVVFVTDINSSAPGGYGVYDYESKVPALLRNYSGSGGEKIYLYYELQ